MRRRDGLYIDDLGSLNGTYVNRRRIESHRLADGDEIQVGKYKLSYLEKLGRDGRLRAARPARRDSASRPRKALTIGAVCKILQSEFDDISISKIRYLEDQKLLTPRRTPGGYRLYSQSDVERLRTILRLQRDEFLPLRVIRQELAAGGDIDLGGGDKRGRRRRRAAGDPRQHLAAPTSPSTR